MLLGRVWCSFNISGNRPRLQSHHKSDLSRDGGDAGLCACYIRKLGGQTRLACVNLSHGPRAKCSKAPGMVATLGTISPKSVSRPCRALYAI